MDQCLGLLPMKYKSNMKTICRRWRDAIEVVICKPPDNSVRSPKIRSGKPSQFLYRYRYGQPGAVNMEV